MVDNLVDIMILPVGVLRDKADSLASQARDSNAQGTRTPSQLF